MRWTRIAIHRFRSLFRRESTETDLLHEIESEAKALAPARREFGSVELIKEKCRDERRVNWWEDVLGDSRSAFRSLRRSPAFTLTAVLTVALGIGLNTAVFSVIHTVLLDPLPFREPERLVHIAETHPDFASFQVAAPDLFDWQRTATSFEGIVAYTFQAVNHWMILGDGEPEPVQVVQASQGLFGLLGVQPLLGRTYTAEEERMKAPVAVISESLWRRKYGSDPGIIGRKIRLIALPVSVIGVAAKRDAQPGWADVWLPLSFLDIALTESRRFRPLEVIGRLKAGATLETAQAEMTGLADRLSKAYPDTNGRVGISVMPMSSWFTGEVRPALLIAWAAVSLVFLLACANVAHLVLVRTAHRSRELALRAALGAGSRAYRASFWLKTWLWQSLAVYWVWPWLSFRCRCSSA